VERRKIHERNISLANYLALTILRRIHVPGIYRANNVFLGIIIIIPLLIHWKMLLPNKWPYTIYLTTHLSFCGLISKKLGISILQVQEMFCYILDSISLLIIAVPLLEECRAGSLNKNAIKISLILPPILYFEFYPYNKLNDAGFLGLYAVYTISAALTIYLLFVLLKYLTGRLSSSSLLIKSLIISFTLLLTTIFIGEWDPRILLYPAIFYLLLTIVTSSIVFLYVIVNPKVARNTLKNLAIMTIPIPVLVLTILPLGLLRIEFAEDILPVVPLNLNAFVGFYDLFHLVSGTSWISKAITNYMLALSFFLTSTILVISLPLISYKFITNDSKRLLYRLVINSLILAYVITLFLENNMRNIVSSLLHSEQFLLMSTKWTLLRNLLILFRVPRFMDFSNKVIVTLLLILTTSKFLQLKNLKRSSLIPMMMLVLVILSTSVTYPLVTYGSVLKSEPSSAIIVGSRPKIIKHDFLMADWNKEKLLLEAFLKEGIYVRSLELYTDNVFATTVKKYAMKFMNLEAFDVNSISNYYVIRSTKLILVGCPILVPQGLYLGSLAWKYGYVPIYLDQIMGSSTFKKILKLGIPIIIYKDKNSTITQLALSMLLNNVINVSSLKLIVLAPAMYAVDFHSRLKVWSPGFIGDPHHGIFYEPEDYEYDYTYKLSWGVVQCCECKEPLTIPFTVEYSNEYILISRVMSTNNGTLTIVIDNKRYFTKHITKTIGVNNKLAFLWLDFGRLSLEKGTHSLRIYWQGTRNSFIYVNVIVFVPCKAMQKAISSAEEYIAKHGITLDDIRKEPFRIENIKSYIQQHECNSIPFAGEACTYSLLLSANRYSKIAIVLNLLYGYHINVEYHCKVLYTDYIVIPVDYVKTGILLFMPREMTIKLTVHTFQGYMVPIRIIFYLVSYLLAIICCIIFFKAFKQK